MGLSKDDANRLKMLFAFGLSLLPIITLFLGYLISNKGMIIDDLNDHLLPEFIFVILLASLHLTFYVLLSDVEPNGILKLIKFRVWGSAGLVLFTLFLSVTYAFLKVSNEDSWLYRKIEGILSFRFMWQTIACIVIVVSVYIIFMKRFKNE